MKLPELKKVFKKWWVHRMYLSDEYIWTGEIIISKNYIIGKNKDKDVARATLANEQSVITWLWRWCSVSYPDLKNIIPKEYESAAIALEDLKYKMLLDKDVMYIDKYWINLEYLNLFREDLCMERVRLYQHNSYFIIKWDCFKALIMWVNI